MFFSSLLQTHLLVVVELCFQIDKLYRDMSINSKYAPAGREMAATSSHLYHGAAVGGARDGELYSSDYSSSEEELGMAGAEEDRRRLLQQRDEPYLAAAVPGLVHPHHVVTHVGHQGGLPPAAAGPMAAGNGQGEAQNTQYGSVSSSLPPNSRNKARWKRYRLPFLILLVFDCGLVVFLSIIAYDSKVRMREREIREVCVCEGESYGSCLERRIERERDRVTERERVMARLVLLRTFL